MLPEHHLNNLQMYYLCLLIFLPVILFVSQLDQQSCLLQLLFAGLVLPDNQMFSLSFLLFWYLLHLKTVSTPL